MSAFRAFLQPVGSFVDYAFGVFQRQPLLSLLGVNLAAAAVFRARVWIAQWLHGVMPWAHSAVFGWVKLRRAAATPANAGLARTTAGAAPHAAPAATAAAASDEDAGGLEQQEARVAPTVSIEREMRDRGVPAAYRRELAQLTGAHWRAFAHSLGVLPSQDADLVAELQRAVVLRPPPRDWQLLAASVADGGIRFVDARVGAKHMWHTDNELAIDAVAREAARRTRARPSRRLELASAVAAAVAAAAAAVDDAAPMAADAASPHASPGGGRHGLIIELLRGDDAAADDDDDAVIAQLELASYESPQRLARAVANLRGLSASGPRPATDFDLASPRVDGVADEATARHVDLLLETFMGGSTATADGVSASEFALASAALARDLASPRNNTADIGGAADIAPNIFRAVSASEQSNPKPVLFVSRGRASVAVAAATPR